ncbi:MAG: DNA cytosine methyltransferase [Burkholderiales bacterium]|nr:MAG: DNA cytosine methyltransferase [Burkholderiales bacterium]
MSIPVIDLFAGPGGLGEGFSKVKSTCFEIVVSIEKDAMAYETLRLRAAHRALQRDSSAAAETWQLWDHVLETAPWNITFDQLRESGDPAVKRACLVAESEALHLELGPDNRESASSEIRARLTAHSRTDQLPRNAVLIGGPPCQAYSIVGRSRNKGTKGYAPEADHRHFLYREYLRVIAEFQPAVFVMENVKGILTSRVKERKIFQTIMRDLKHPDVAGANKPEVEYVLQALAETDGLLDAPTPDDFIVKAEDYGVPQARHRVIILGIRKDVFEKARTVDKLTRAAPPTVWDVIADLPPLRPQLSYRGKGLTWLDALKLPLFDTAIVELRRTGNPVDAKVAAKLTSVRERLQQRVSDPGYGADRVRLNSAAKERKPRKLEHWYCDRSTDLLFNHESRAHMPTDLVRYLFVAAFGEVAKSSARLMDFPRCLLPNHKNVDPENLDESIFKDRFRVQIAGVHSMTVTSHIAKDGHAFIHPTPSQCRSLTVREAARLQTFPDSYVFLGNRTSQYTQVGNAVPPLLAEQIAAVVAGILKRAGHA